MGEQAEEPKQPRWLWETARCGAERLAETLNRLEKDGAEVFAVQFAPQPVPAREAVLIVVRKPVALPPREWLSG
jgi:hypothetical protein